MRFYVISIRVKTTAMKILIVIAIETIKQNLYILFFYLDIDNFAKSSANIITTLSK